MTIHAMAITPVLSRPSPRRVRSWVGDDTLVEALDLMGPTVMISGDCEREGMIVPLLGQGLYGWVAW